MADCVCGRRLVSRLFGCISFMLVNMLAKADLLMFSSTPTKPKDHTKCDDSDIGENGQKKNRVSCMADMIGRDVSPLVFLSTDKSSSHGSTRRSKQSECLHHLILCQQP